MTGHPLDPERRAVLLALEGPDRQVVLRAALEARLVLGVPGELDVTTPAHVLKLRQLAAYLGEWADVADRATAAG